jgi:FHA domain.
MKKQILRNALNVRRPSVSMPIRAKRKKSTNIDKNTNSDEVKTAEPIHPKNLLKYQGKLEWGRIFYKKSACLKVGSNIIGRKDYDMPSDISFDDDYMSRRSVSIDVEKDTNRAGYKFKLTVINAANPVFVGSTQLYVGNSIYLNYGDTIKMGNTVMTFKESK